VIMDSVFWIFKTKFNKPRLLFFPFKLFPKRPILSDNLNKFSSNVHTRTHNKSIEALRGVKSPYFLYLHVYNDLILNIARLLNKRVNNS